MVFRHPSASPAPQRKRSALTWQPTMAAALWALGAPAWAATPWQPLNDTGMTTCLDLATSTFSSACSGTGQDSEFGRDAKTKSNLDGHAGFSFQKVCNSGEAAGTGACPSKPTLGAGKNRWGCNQDLVTGLMWEVKTRNGGLRDYRNSYTFNTDGSSGSAQAFAAQVNQAGLCGHADWRLPSTGELLGLLDYGKRAYPDPMIDQTWFPNTPAAAYWTADLEADSAGTPVEYQFAWLVDFSYTGGAAYSWWISDSQLPVRLVRGVLPVASRRFVALGDGSEVQDRHTGLIWQRCAQGQTWTGKTCTGSGQAYTWSGALAAAKAAASSSGKAWRVPNIKELQSITNLARRYPAVDTKAFPGAPDSYFWSSTVESDTTWGKVFYIRFYSGVVDAQGHDDDGTAAGSSYPNQVRLVR